MYRDIQSHHFQKAMENVAAVETKSPQNRLQGFIPLNRKDLKSTSWLKPLSLHPLVLVRIVMNAGISIIEAVTLHNSMLLLHSLKFYSIF